MMDDKQPHEEATGEHDQRRCQPPGHAHGEINQIPKADIGNERVGHLPESTRHRRLLVFGNDFLPAGAAWRWFFFLLVQICSHYINSLSAFFSISIIRTGYSKLCRQYQPAKHHTAMTSNEQTSSFKIRNCARLETIMSLNRIVRKANLEENLSLAVSL